MEDVKNRINKHISMLVSDGTQTSGMDFILVFITKDNHIHHNVGKELCFLIDRYDEKDLTVEKALNHELIKENCSFGAIYERKHDNFELIVKSGF